LFLSYSLLAFPHGRDSYGALWEFGVQKYVFFFTLLQISPAFTKNAGKTRHFSYKKLMIN